MFNTFYSKRREFSIASKKESVESIISGVNKLVDKISPLAPFIFQMLTKPKNENNAQAKTA